MTDTYTAHNIDKYMIVKSSLNGKIIVTIFNKIIRILNYLREILLSYHVSLV